jgi:hypothetical protein
MFISLLMTNYHIQLAKEITQSRHSEPSADLCKRLTVAEDLSRQDPHISKPEEIRQTYNLIMMY